MVELVAVLEAGVQRSARWRTRRDAGVVAAVAAGLALGASFLVPSKPSGPGSEAVAVVSPTSSKTSGGI